MTRQELADLVRPALESEGFELVDCSVSRTPRSQTFRFAVDREGGVPIAACERASQLVVALLDANPVLRGNYQLEVSSPGMNRPIWSADHFRRFVGERVRIELIESAEPPLHLAGQIGPLDGDAVVVVIDRVGERRVALSAIRRANLQIDPWKKRSADGPSGMSDARGDDGSAAD